MHNLPLPLTLLVISLCASVAVGANLRAYGATNSGFVNTEDAGFWDRSFRDEGFQSVITPSPTTPSPPSTPGPTSAGATTPEPTSAGATTPEPTSAGATTPEPTASTPSPAPTTITSTLAPTTDTSSPAPTAGTSTLEPTTGTSTPIPTSDTSSPSPTSDTSSSAPTAFLSSLEPTVETSSPIPSADTPSPAEIPSSAPTQIAPGQGCVLEASVECVLEDNSTCSSLSLISPENATCVLPDGPTQLGWIYRGTNCDDSRTDFECTDVDGGPNMDPLVNILVENAEGEEVFRETGVTLGEYFVIPSDDGATLDEEISVTIYTGKDEDDGVLQISSGIPTSCVAGNNLTLGNSYGALEFASYRDDDDFAQSVQPVEWQYSVVSVASPKAFLSVVLSITNGETLIQTPNVLLEEGDSYMFTVPSEINLISPGNYTGEVSAAATSVSSPDQIECGTSASSTVTIA